MTGIFLIVNIGIIALFLGMVFFCNRKQRIMLLLAIVYATIFENMNMLLAKGEAAAYYYHPDFFLFFFDTPVFVILSWSMLIVSSWELSKRMFQTIWERIASATLLVLLIDLSLDIFAIRLHFWTWVGYDWHEGFFGVPAANYAGWFLVAIIFFMVYNALEKRSWFVATTPIVAYVLFLPIMGLYREAVQYFALGKETQILALFASLAVLYLGLLVIEKRPLEMRENLVRFSLFVRGCFHLFSVICIIIFGFNSWPLVCAFLLFFALELLVFRSHVLREKAILTMERIITQLDKMKKAE